MASAYVSQSNGFLPSHEASGKLITDYSRKPSSFAVMRYSQMQKVTKPVGAYLRITPDQAGRIGASNLANWRWPDGQDAFPHNDNHKEFEFHKFFTERIKFDFVLGDMAIDHTDFDIIATYAAMCAQQAMTARTLQAALIMADSANYGSTSTGTASGGGLWTASELTDRWFARSLMYGVQQIQLKTLSAVKITDLCLVVNPVLAGRIANSGEIAQYLAQSPFAMDRVTGEGWDFAQAWGLPKRYQGVEIIVEETARENANVGGASNQSYVLDNSTAALIARPGALMSPAGAPTFSFLTFFMLEEMTVETLPDPVSRRTIGRVVENYDCVATAPAASHLFTTVGPA